LETGKITSCEALLRWQNPKFGFVSPGQFIPIAEDSGLIIEIGNWVIEQACKQLREWKKLGISNIRIAVNISPKQFKEDTLASKIFQYLKEYDIDPKMLEIEITESSMTDEEDTMTILKQLKSMGLIISIDDFGTGYSSLSYIKRYPIDIIKIDQSFIRDMDNDEKDRAIAKTIVHLAHSLGLDVIAEGVEKEEHVRFLKEYQCKKAQGFLFSKPVSVEQLMKVVSLT
jgi:FOG: EAL domain